MRRAALVQTLAAALMLASRWPNPILHTCQKGMRQDLFPLRRPDSICQHLDTVFELPTSHF